MYLLAVALSAALSEVAGATDGQALDALLAKNAELEARHAEQARTNAALRSRLAALEVTGAAAKGADATGDVMNKASEDEARDRSEAKPGGTSVKMAMEVHVGDAGDPYELNGHLNAAYLGNRRIRREKALRHYAHWNMGPEHPCDTTDCKSGANDCCSICKLTKGGQDLAGSKLKAGMTERLMESAAGLVYGGCTLVFDDQDQTAFGKFWDWHNANPPNTPANQDLETVVDMFGIDGGPKIEHPPCKMNGASKDGTWIHNLVRQAVWEIRHERPEVTELDLGLDIIKTVANILMTDNFAVLVQVQLEEWKQSMDESLLQMNSTIQMNAMATKPLICGCVCQEIGSYVNPMNAITVLKGAAQEINNARNGDLGFRYD